MNTYDRVERRLNAVKHRSVWNSSPPRPVESEKKANKKIKEKHSQNEEIINEKKRKASSSVEMPTNHDEMRIKQEINGINEDNRNQSIETKEEATVKEKTEEKLSYNDILPSQFLEMEVNNFRDETYRDRVVRQDEDIGPQPLRIESIDDRQITYGKALLPGEGQAIAAFVQQNMRIPRRGEIGWNGDDIQQLEETGYVMSGSRHKRMNAVRIRKENQVYSAEEKRALALITMEEKQQRDNKIIADFRTTLKNQLEGKQ